MPYSTIAAVAIATGSPGNPDYLVNSDNLKTYQL